MHSIGYLMISILLVSGIISFMPFVEAQTPNSTIIENEFTDAQLLAHAGMNLGEAIRRFSEGNSSAGLMHIDIAQNHLMEVLRRNP